MAVWGTIAIGLCGIPLIRACWANRHTALSYALFWASLAWAGWLWSAFNESITARYLALCLTGCTGVAVLGARWPGAAAWNAVVGGLLAVLMLPLFQQFLAGASWRSGPIWAAFLAVTLIVSVGNYLPTRLGLGALALLLACAVEARQLGAEIPRDERGLALTLAAAAPWLAWLGILTRRRRVSECDRLWHEFRDRFGFVWAQRLREQFNSSARHGGLRVELGSRSLRREDATAPDARQKAASLEVLVALMKRFGNVERNQ